MFERFTESARRVMICSQEDGRQLNHNYLGTEHLLLGLDPAVADLAAVHDTGSLVGGRSC
jgi:hypothetical protein